MIYNNVVNSVVDYPKIKESIYFNDIFINKEGKGKIIVGIMEPDMHFMIPAEEQKKFESLIKLMDGTNSKTDIMEKSRISESQLDKIINKLQSKGYLESNSDEKNKEINKVNKYNEVDYLSLKIFNYEFKNIKNKEKVKTIANRSYKIFIGIILAMIAILFVINAVSGFSIVKNISFMDWISYDKGYNNKYLMAYIYINIGMILMFVVHEIGHIIAGLRVGIQPLNLSFVLYLGIIPMFYVRNKNIYSLKRKDIYRVLFAGIKMNFILGLLLINLFILTENEVLKILALSNFRLVIFNLWPLSLSDGYFILCIFLRRPNLRYKLHQFISKPASLLNYSNLERLYTCMATTTILVSVGIELFWIVSIFNIKMELRITLLVCLLLLYVIILHFIDKRKFNKLNQN